MNDFCVFAKDRKEIEFETVKKLVNEFFPNMYEKTKKQNNDIVLTYRAGQSKFVKQILDAIRYHQILFVQAGVGIGKTFGYLVPIFYTYQNVSRMDHFVISTSNIGLQQQLLTDINKVSSMLKIPIKAVIAKGVNNYACMQRVQQTLFDARTTKEEKEIIQNILNEIKEKNTIDKDELKLVSDEVWDLVKFKNRGACSNCSYSKYCLYRKISKEIDEANIIVTNHHNFAKSVLESRDYIKHSNMFVFDEAHQLENAIRDVQGDILSIDIITKTLSYFVENFITDSFQQDYIIQTIKEIGNFFSNVRKKESRYFFYNMKESTVGIVDCDKLPFSTRGLEEQLDIITNRFTKIYQLLSRMNYNSNNYRMEQLKKWIYIFEDMKLKNDSKNIYWVNFYKKNMIEIGYTAKNISNITNKLTAKNVPIVFTSGTLLDSNEAYEYFKQSISLDKEDTIQQPICHGQKCISPYNYEQNSLFYYDPYVANPNNDHQRYLDELVVKIVELISITNGRTLVLFTSKSDMNYVFDKLDQSQFSFPILIQGKERSNQQLYSDFENNSKTCLFSTGAWEGIDVKGKSLSNVIITRLPFATDNAIMQYKQRIFGKKNDCSVFLNDMLQKLSQGTGRLIRGKYDKGIICCLDSRFVTYQGAIMKSLPFINYTDDLNDVCQFSSRYITNQDGPRGPYKKRTKKEDN